MSELPDSKTDEQESLLHGMRQFFDNFPEEWIPPKDPDHPKVKIINAARELFAKKGFAGAGLREIASKAEVNQAMINYYFSSKELLYRRVLVAQLYEMFMTTISLENSDLPSDRFITELSARIIDTLRQKPLYALLFIREVSDGGGTFRKIIREMGAKGPEGFRELVVKKYRQGVDEGKLRELDINVIAMMNITIAYCFMFVDSFFSQLSGISATNDDVWQEMRKTIIDIFSHGLLKDKSSFKETE